MAYVYVLKCSNNTFYFGSTTNLKRRLEEHQSGHSKYTRHLRPVVLVGYKIFPTSSAAKWFERSLKKSAWKRKLFLASLKGSSLSESIDS